MDYILTSMAPALIAASIQKLRDEADGKNRLAAYQLREDVVLGKTVGKLIRNIGEGAKGFAERQQLFSDCGAVGYCKQRYMGALWGKTITRTIEGGTPEQQERFDAIYKWNRIDHKQRAWGQNQIVYGDMWSLVSWSERWGRTILHSVDPRNMQVIVDPDDPFSAMVTIETRIDPNNPKKKEEHVWTPEAWVVVDQDGRAVEVNGVAGWRDNPYGVNPYTHAPGVVIAESFWGQSPLDGAIACHLRANNLRSEAEILSRYQIHSQMVIESNQVDDSLTTGPRDYIRVDVGGSLYYAASNAPVEKMVDFYNRAREEVFEIAGIPAEAVRGGSVASGYALEQIFRAMQEIASDLRVSGTAFEEETGNKVCIVENVHNPGSGLKPDMQINVEMPESVIPRDKEAERNVDMMEVDAGRMTLKDYLKKWRPDIGDEAAIDAYIVELAAQKASKAPSLPAAPGGFVL